jgi:hypothetical protein
VEPLARCIQTMVCNLARRPVAVLILFAVLTFGLVGYSPASRFLTRALALSPVSTPTASTSSGWSPAPEMGYDRVEYTITTLPDGRLLVVGG